jgi:hypothetical protein
MLNFANDLWPIIIYSVILTGYILALHFLRTSSRLKKRPTPFTENVLRAPGQSLVNQLDGLNEDIGLNVRLLITIPFIFYSAYISYLFFYQRDFSPLVVQILAGFGATITIFYLVKTLKLIKRRRIIRLGYESDITVGQELNQLVLDGNYVYHDFPADEFNIDHIVVGHSGIFVVETKGRSKPTPHNRHQDATVEYNGKVLNFPDGDDFQIIEQAEQRASWLSNWISSAIGEPVAARAIVALPGWLVKRTSPDGISVVNPKQFPSLFKYIKPRTLTDEMIRRTVHQIEQKCLNIVADTKEYIRAQPVL